MKDLQMPWLSGDCAWPFVKVLILSGYQMWKMPSPASR